VLSGLTLGDEVYGATNQQFSGAYAEYALPSARMMARKHGHKDRVKLRKLRQVDP